VRRPARGELARYAAPAAFLLAVTIAVLLVRSGLQGGDGAATTGSAQVTGTSPGSTRTATTGKRPKRRRAAPRYYRVQSGDTFGSIAAAEGTTIDRLRALNPNVDPTALQTGQRIRVK
jgi:LysM repeat protein